MTNPVTLEVCIIGSDYVMEDGKPVIHLWGKTKKGETVLILDKVFRPYFYVETRQGFEVAKALPDGMGWIVPEKVEASLKNGVLTIRLPKTKKSQSVSIKVKEEEE